MTALSAPSTLPAVGLNVRSWLKPLPVTGGHGVETGIASRLTVGSATADAKLVGQAQLGPDTAILRSTVSGGVAGGPVAVTGRTSVTATVGFDRVALDGVAKGHAGLGPVALDGTAKAHAGVTADNAVLTGSATGTIGAGPANLSGRVAGSAAAGVDGLKLAAATSGTANLGSAGLGAALTGVAQLGSGSATFGTTAAADAHAFGVVASINAAAKVRFDANFPFMHVDASLAASVRRQS